MTIFRKLCHHSSAFIYTLILILYLSNVKYYNIFDKFEFEPSRAKSRSQWLFLEKHCHRSNAHLYGPILILYLSNVKYYNIFDKFEFEPSRAKVKVSVAIFRKTLSLL